MKLDLLWHNFTTGTPHTLRRSVTLDELERIAQTQSDTEAALAMQRAKRGLLKRLGRLTA